MTRPAHMAKQRCRFVMTSGRRQGKRCGAPAYYYDCCCWHAGVVGNRHQRLSRLRAGE